MTPFPVAVGFWLGALVCDAVCTLRANHDAEPRYDHDTSTADETDIRARVAKNCGRAGRGHHVSLWLSWSGEAPHPTTKIS